MPLVWHAKPSGGYSIGSTEGLDNITCINGFLNGRNYALEAQAGVIGNMVHESALNPWRWQGDTVNEWGGYGLFQFTPARNYWMDCYDVDGYAPNRSTVTVDPPTARPSDGYAQLVVFDEDILNKWTTFCWRPYWDRTEYPTLWTMRNTIISTYGSDGGLSLAQFRTINNVSHSTFAFLACYEGPAVPNFWTREETALQVYGILSGDTPPPPTPPPGPGPGPGPTPIYPGSKIMFYLRPWWKRF